MYNKKALSKAKAELDKAKAPKKPKDIITDPMGQWKYPGLPTRIPGNNITMEGVGYPVLGVANNGQRKIMLPGADYTFPGADYVDEYPQMKRGGTRKRRKTKSLSGTNELMLPHPLLRNYKNRVYDPNVDYFQDGGYIEAELTDDEIEEYRKGGYIVEDISIPELNQARKGKIVNTSKSPKPSVYIAKNDKDYAFRKKAYDDSLAIYNLDKDYSNLSLKAAKLINDPNSDESKYFDIQDKLKKNYSEQYKILKNSNVPHKLIPIKERIKGDRAMMHPKPTQTIVKPNKSETDEKTDKPKPNADKSKTLNVPVNATYEDSLSSYNNYIKRKEIFDNLNPNQFKSKKELYDYLKKQSQKYPSNESLAVKTNPIKKQFNHLNQKINKTDLELLEYVKPKGSQAIKPKENTISTSANNTQPVKQPVVKQSKYPEGYQPYSLYGKVLDPEVYGYGESILGKPVELAQGADMILKKMQMEKYKKSEQYPWKKQKGGVTTYKSKDGTITNTITKPNGDTVIQVKTKDGKYYEKVNKGLPQFVKDEFKKRAEWEDRSSGAAQPVDEFWTLPMGMTSAGVKGAGALAKGVGTLLKDAGKSSLAQATKAGTKAFFNNTPKWITKVAPNLAPGINLNNLLTSYGIVEGANAYLDKDSDVRKANKEAYKNPNYNTITDAVYENILNSLDFSGLAMGNKIGKVAQTVKGNKYFKALPNKKLIPSMQFSGSDLNNLYSKSDPSATINYGYSPNLTASEKLKLFFMNKNDKQQYLANKTVDEAFEYADKFMSNPEYQRRFADVKSMTPSVEVDRQDVANHIRNQVAKGKISSVDYSKDEIMNMTDKQLLDKFENPYRYNTSNVAWYEADKLPAYINRTSPLPQQKSVQHLKENIKINPYSDRKVGVYNAGKNQSLANDKLKETVSVESKNLGDLFNVTVHEALGHGKTFGNVTFTQKEKELLQSVFKENNTASSYIKDPTEVMARIDEIRSVINRENPFKTVTEKDLDNFEKLVNSRTDIPGVGKEGTTMFQFIKNINKKNLARTMNKMYGALPVGITGTALINKPKQKKSNQMKKGGIVADLTQNEIDDYIAKGYIVEDID